jgi:hypothetical protein
MTALSKALRLALTGAGDPVRAAGMQAYLKSTMPCLGVRLPQTRRLVRQVAAEHPWDTPERWGRCGTAPRPARNATPLSS